jgi:hypothetical protein
MVGDPVDPLTNQPTTMGPIQLNLRKIPFVQMDIGDSLLKDVSRHQRALLNLCSSDVSYALKSNFPFYTEQRDPRDMGLHLRAGDNGTNTATAGGQGANDKEIQVGAGTGVQYDMKAERPGFIHPSPEPLEASIKLQEKLEDDIRKLVNLAVSNKSNRPVSAQAKDMDNQGLEAGLSFIGMVLETGERKIAEYWASYEEVNPNKRSIAVIKYPDRYNLKSDNERIDEAGKLTKVMLSVPGRTAKKEISKLIVHALFGGKTSVDIIEKIEREIDRAPYTTSDLDIISKAVEMGACSEKTASVALGFLESEHLAAREDHIARLQRIAESQMEMQEAKEEDKEDDDSDPAARGVPDLSANPAAGKEEKAESRDTTFRDTTKVPVRGEGK